MKWVHIYIANLSTDDIWNLYNWQLKYQYQNTVKQNKISKTTIKHGPISLCSGTMNQHFTTLLA